MTDENIRSSETKPRWFESRIVVASALILLIADQVRRLETEPLELITLLRNPGIE